MDFKIQQQQAWILDKIAEMICGNSPYDQNFPYRSSSGLNIFFSNMNLPYLHRGETRKYWVRDVLTELNANGSFTYSNILSSNVIDVMEHLFDIGYFIDFFEQERENPFVDNVPAKDTVVKYKQAIESINVILKTTGLCLSFDDVNFGVKISTRDAIYISSAIRELEVKKIITFNPAIFKIPDEKPQTNLVAVMMPFSKEFDDVYSIIKKSCLQCNLICKRAKDIWEDSVIMQDVFNLIYRSIIVISDFSEKNSNVLYETGIAHTLGKIVVPISRSISDIPFDLRHHRVATYLPNTEGLLKLEQDLSARLQTVTKKW